MPQDISDRASKFTRKCCTKNSLLNRITLCVSYVFTRIGRHPGTHYSNMPQVVLFVKETFPTVHTNIWPIIVVLIHVTFKVNFSVETLTTDFATESIQALMITGMALHLSQSFKRTRTHVTLKTSLCSEINILIFRNAAGHFLFYFHNLVSEQSAFTISFCAPLPNIGIAIPGSLICKSRDLQIIT